MPRVMLRHLVVVAAWAAIASSAACASSLPEQDRRILEATPTAKLSSDDIWKDYQQNAADADRKYWGRAIEVAGKVARVVKDKRQLLFGDENAQVRASLLDDQADAILGEAVEGQRFRLKCFCGGVERGGTSDKPTQTVILKSCVKP